MPFEKGSRLPKDVTIKFPTQSKNRRLADVGHPISREVFGNAFDYRENDQEQRNHPPGMKARGRYETLQGKGCRSGARIPVGKRLIEDRHYQRTRCGFQHGHNDHREGSCNEGASVRQKVS